MKRLKIVINKLSGNGEKAYDKIILDKLKHRFPDEEYTVTEVIMIADEKDTFELDECDAVAVCGGDGTLSNALNIASKTGIDVLYFPYGTLNEFSGHMKKQGSGLTISEIGRVDSHQFVYVFASGSFTPIGYSTSNKSKKRFKWLAYIFKVFKEYKVYDMKAKLVADGKTDEGVYSLIMCLDSQRCFGFRFNRLYKFNDGLFHLLTIRAPKGHFRKFKIFFPLFRAFFIGFKKEYRSKNMTFKAVKNLEVELDKNYPFCLDGEKYYPGEKFIVSVQNSPSKIKVVL